MKKITSFLSMMVLCCITAFAQSTGITPVTDLTNLKDDATYTLRTERCALYFFSEKADMLCTTNATGATVEYDPMDTNQHFNIKTVDGKYYLYSIGAQKYVKHSGEQSVFVDDIAEASELSIEATGNAYPWLLKLAGNGMNTQIKGQHASGMVINSWVTVDAGNSFEIAEIDLSNIDPYQFAFERLNAAITNVNAALQVDSLRKGVQVGSWYGDYKPEIVSYFLAKHDSAVALQQAVVDADAFDPLKAVFATIEDADAFTARYLHSKDSVANNRVDREIQDIKPGYYTISSAITFTKKVWEYTYYTEEEADSWNSDNFLEPGMEGYIEPGTKKDSVEKTVAQDPKALYEYNGKANWGDRQETADFLWKISLGEDTTFSYKIINMNQSMTFGPIELSAPVSMEENNTSEFFISWWGKDTLVDNRIVDLVAIRNIESAANSYKHIHCNGHGGGTGSNGNIVGWVPDASASQWFLTPIDEETAQKWMDASAPVLELRAKVKVGDSIAAAFPAQLAIAQDSIVNPAAFVVSDASQFYSAYSTNDGQTIPAGQTVYNFLLDNKANTYWHSRWENGDVEPNTHYLQINAPAEIQGQYMLRYVRRASGADQVKVFTIKGYAEAPTEATTFDDGTEIAVVTYEEPYETDGDTLVTGPYDLTGYKYIRIYASETTNNRGYWHAAELNFINPDVPAKITLYEKTQYLARKAEADALKAAVDLWNEKEFADDSLALLTDQTFIDAYNNIVATGEAWGKVYVNPAELRTAIAAVPDAKLFPIGTNPGFWSDESKITVVGVGAQAQAYNENGAYTKEETAKWIKDIHDADSATFAGANKVKTGVWYQFAYPAETTFEEYGWDKVAGEKTIKKATESNTGVDIVRCEGIFDKVVAAGLGTNEYFYEAGGKVDTVTIYNVEDAGGDFYAGQNMFFFKRDEVPTGGENLFRFIEATDSSYIIQNQATGLFLRGGHPVTLSPIPTYWNVNAIGAGTNLVGYTDVLGNEVSNLKYLHGQNSDRRLVCWEANTLGSRSMMYIEEVEAVAEEPATEYQQEVWPGMINAMVMPVDVTIVEDEYYDPVTAYGAKLTVTETDTTLAFCPITDETIKAGCPFFLVADADLIVKDSANYESKAEATERIKKEINPNYVTGSEVEGETWNYWDNPALNSDLSMCYAIALMDHGMQVDTVARWNGSLRGTMKADTISAGKGYVAVDNKLALVKETSNIAAYTAYVDANFDGVDEYTEGSLIIDMNGEGIDDTGIAEVLNTVAKSGNIYNAAGQLVGKGNINTVNKLPAGIYIVNGVKVTKR